MYPPEEPDAPLGDGDHADVAARLQDTLTGPSLDSATRQRHLHAIRARAASLPAPAPAPGSASSPVAVGGWAHRLASTVAVVGLVVVLGASGAVAASHDTLPGQALHPVKLLSEQLVLAAPMSTQRAVDRHLLFAERRLDEAAALAHRAAEPTLVAEAITAHTRLLTRAGELAGDNTQLAGRVDAAAAVAHRRLARLLDEGLPEVAADRARAALSAAEARLDRRPAAPPPVQSAPATPERRPDALEERPTPPDPTSPSDRAPAPAPTTPGPPATTSPERTPPEHRSPERRSEPAPDRPAPDRPVEPDAPGQRRDRQPRETAPSTPSRPAPDPQRAPSPGEPGGEAGDPQPPREGEQSPTDRVRPDMPLPPTTP